MNLEFDLFENSDTDEEVCENKKDVLLPWIEKYRPGSLDGIISHEHIINSLKLFKKNKNMQHLLFYGPPGTGKTSTILAYARELYGKNFNFMVMELNASDDRGIEVVRNKIKQFVSSDNIFCRFTSDKKEDIFKLVILDEVDAMTNEAQAILRHVVESFTKQARFCLICNYLRKITPALQSRCVPFRFSPIKKSLMIGRLRYIVKSQKIKILDSGLNTTITRSSGDMRKAINILQSSSMIYSVIDSNKINNCFGYPQDKDIKKIIKSLLTDDINKCYGIIYEICKTNGLLLGDIITEIYNIIMRVIIFEKYIIKELKKISINSYALILSKLRIIEINNITSINYGLQISALVSIFKLKVDKN